MSPRALALTGAALTINGACGLGAALDARCPSTALIVATGVTLLLGLVLLLDAYEKTS